MTASALAAYFNRYLSAYGVTAAAYVPSTSVAQVSLSRPSSASENLDIVITDYAGEKTIHWFRPEDILTADKNWIESRTFYGTGEYDYHSDVTYYNGLGLPEMHVSGAVSGNGKSIVTPVVYDECLRAESVLPLSFEAADISLKTSMLPKDKEMAVRQKIAAALTRGNIDFFITFEPNAADSAKKINMALAMEYYNQLFELGSKIAGANGSIVGAANLWTQGPNDLLATIIRMPEVMDAKKQDVITDENWPVVEACIDQALANINAFRAQEGEILYKDVTDKVHAILDYSKQIEQFEKERVEAIREKILSRFAELKAEPDHSRLEQEMIFYIEKLDINEEKVRLRQHCNYFLDTITNEPNPGKKLGFIAQEMGREINTTGSKANHTEIQKIVVKMKDELEKIKEQSLNIL